MGSAAETSAHSGPAVEDLGGTQSYHRRVPRGRVRSGMRVCDVPGAVDHVGFPARFAAGATGMQKGVAAGEEQTRAPLRFWGTEHAISEPRLLTLLYDEVLGKYESNYRLIFLMRLDGYLLHHVSLPHPRST